MEHFGTCRRQGVTGCPTGIISVVALAGPSRGRDRVRRPSRSGRGHTHLGGDRVLSAVLGHVAIRACGANGDDRFPSAQSTDRTAPRRRDRSGDR